MRTQCFGLWIAASLFLGLLVVGPAAAEEDKYAAIRETLDTCFTCHGPNGVSDDPQIPILAGQHMYYLYVQLKDFKAERRVSPVMIEFVSILTKEEMRAIATFFSEQEWPNIGYRADPARARKGEVATIAGQCVQCHRGGYEGSSGTPHLAGQHAAYLEKTMLDFKSKARANAAAKSSLMKTYSAEQISSMAEFLAGM
ncbi:MAG: hypothetical protein IIA34_06020 [Proteobacteria bacterium]|nr:hypothetical protein [Pseudomonadota bacterium]